MATQSFPILGCMKRFASRLAADRAGNILIITGLIIIALTFAVGFGLDYAHATSLQTRLNADADAAALSVVTTTSMHQQSGSATCISGTDNTADTMAIRALDAFVAQIPGFSGTPACPTPGSGNSSTQATETLTLAAPAGSTLTGNITVTATVSLIGNNNLGRKAQVSYQAQALNSFAGILHAPSLPISGSATSSAQAAPYLNFYVMIDDSPSMLIPSTTAGQIIIYQATQCDFACHEQVPHNDDFPHYINDLSGNNVFLPSDYYSGNNNTGGNNFYTVNLSTGQVYFGASTASGSTTATPLAGYIYCNNNAQDAIFQATDCNSANSANQVAGWWADGYWLTHNYVAIHPNAAPIDLRIDDATAAAAALPGFAYQQATNNLVSYGIQMFAFDWTGSQKATNGPVSVLPGWGSMVTLNGNICTLSSGSSPASCPSLSVPALGGPIYQDFWYTNRKPTQNTYIDDQATEFYNMFNVLGGPMANPANSNTPLLGTPGDGSSAANPQEILFLITDGMDEGQYPTNRTHSPLTSDILSQCTNLKAAGVKIAILYTTYDPSSISYEKWSKKNVMPYLDPIDQDKAALQSCASPGLNAAPLFYEVSADQNMTTALQTLFSIAVSSARLVK